MLRTNSRLRQTLGVAGVEFLEYAAGAIQRILPHVHLSQWKEGPWTKPRSVWTSSKRTRIRITLVLLVLFIYGPILIVSLSDPSTAVKIEGINYFADTLLFGGAILGLARATRRAE